jgi:hypothetical protein
MAITKGKKLNFGNPLELINMSHNILPYLKRERILYLMFRSARNLMLMNKFQDGIPLLSPLDQFMFRRFALCFTKDKLRPIDGGHSQNVRPDLGTT